MHEMNIGGLIFLLFVYTAVAMWLLFIALTKRWGRKFREFSEALHEEYKAGLEMQKEKIRAEVEAEYKNNCLNCGTLGDD